MYRGQFLERQDQLRRLIPPQALVSITNFLDDGWEIVRQWNHGTLYRTSRKLNHIQEQAVRCRMFVDIFKHGECIENKFSGAEFVEANNTPEA